MQRYNSKLGRYKVRLKLRVVKILGGLCTCCGEGNPYFLTVDHIHNNGVEHRKKFRGSRAVTQVYQDVLHSEHPENTYQLLCMNCNCAKQWYGVCPHQADKGIEEAYRELRSAAAYRYKKPNTVGKDSKGRWVSHAQAFAEGGYS